MSGLPILPEEIVSLIIDINDEHRELDENFEKIYDGDIIHALDCIMVPTTNYDRDIFKRLYRYTLVSPRFSSRGVRQEFLIYCIAYQEGFVDVLETFSRDCKSTFSDFLKYDYPNNYGISYFISDLHEVHCNFSNKEEENISSYYDIDGRDQLCSLDYPIFKRLIENSNPDTILYEICDFVYGYEEAVQVELPWYETLIGYALEITVKNENYHHILNYVKEFIDSKYRKEVNYW